VDHFFCIAGADRTTNLLLTQKWVRGDMGVSCTVSAPSSTSCSTDISVIKRFCL